MANNTKRTVENEPPGFSEAWAKMTAGRASDFAGRKQAYAEFFRAGQESLRDPFIQLKLDCVLIPKKGT